MKSAKAVRPQDATLSEDESHVLLRYGSAVQGNATSPRGEFKAHHKRQENSRVGGTNNPLTAIYAPAHRKLCRIVKGEIDTHMWQNGVMVRTNTKPAMSHTYVEAPTHIPIETLVKRAERLEMTVVEYCEYIGYTGTL